MLLDDLKDYLTSQGGWTGGTDLFVGTIEPTPDTALAVYETGGQSPVRGMGNTAGDHAVERPSIQVVSRAVSYATARANAQKAFLLIDGFPDRLINNVRYKYGEARQSPFLMGRDEQDRVLVAFNADLVKERSSTS